MAIVYSYVRCSTKKQADLGDSLRRQIEKGESWITRNNHTQATMTLVDPGVSTFRGKNKRHDKALGKFLEAIKTGRVKPGSILLIENLDRLSREGMSPALALFNSILESGVDICVLMPTETMYTKESTKDLIGLLIPLVCFYLANLESEHKSERNGEVWAEKRKHASPDVRMDSFKPSWLDIVDDKFVENEGAEAIRFIFEQTAEGKIGQRGMTAELQKRFPAIGRSGSWNGSYVRKVLSDRSVLGERQPHKFTPEGERVPIGKTIVGYYPTIIQESLWHRAQAAKKLRTKQKGPNSTFVNLFTGLLVNVNDGHPMHMQTTHSGTTPQRRLVSYGHLKSMQGADSVSIPYDDLERYILAYLTELHPSDLEPKSSTFDDIRHREQERTGIELRIAELQEALSSPGSGSISSILTAIAKLEGRKDELTDEINGLYAAIQSDAVVHTQDLLTKLSETTGQELHDLRMRLRFLIAELVKQVQIKPEKYNGRVYTAARIVFHTGNHFKVIAFGPNWEVGSNTKWGGDSGINFDLVAAAKGGRNVLEGVDEYVRRMPEPCYLPEILPDGLRQCSSLWLEQQRAKMATSSFRVIGPKLSRFLDYAGDISTFEVSSKLWALFVRSIQLDVKEGKIALNSARIAHARARELVRWLITNGKAGPIDALDMASAKAINEAL